MNCIYKHMQGSAITSENNMKVKINNILFIYILDSKMIIYIHIQYSQPYLL